MREKELGHTDIVMIRPGSDSGAGAADGLGQLPSTGSRSLLRTVLFVVLAPLLLVVLGWRASRRDRLPTGATSGTESSTEYGPGNGQQLQALQERECHLQASAAAIRNLDQRRPVTAHLLETIEQSIWRIQGLWLSRVHLDPSGLLIRGQSLQAAPVGTLIASLRKSPLLKQVQLRSRSRDQETGIWEFEMKALVEPNENS